MTRDVPMSIDGDDKEFQELAQRLRDGKKTTKEGVVGDEHSFREDDELKGNGTAEEVKVGQGGTVEAPAVQHMPQQQPQGAIWERFLHLRSLKVLLVEIDDSTRHVVAALLCNCSYEVIEAANGLQAWKILEDLTNQIDLVLTEVAMPCLSGIGLLSKIMAHKTRKNTPVIMMSSHDSMGLVFKCLSKGAIDFLVKPIRKNELKNLWQHVWRRCHSSSGSGSESGTQTQKSIKSKSFERSDNSGSNDEEDNGSVGLNNRDGSDNGSGTQSSWTKQAVEVDSPKPSQWDHIAECPDSTCAQVVLSNAEISGNKMFSVAIKECPDQKDELGLKVDSSRDLGLILDYRNEVLTNNLGEKHSNPLDIGSSKFNEQLNRGQLKLHCEEPSSKSRCKGPFQSDAVFSTYDLRIHGGESEASNRRTKPSDTESKAINDNEELPSLELSLKRLRGVKDAGTTIQDERNVLRRSDLSAFSRYNAASNAKKSPGGCAGSNSPHNNSLEVTKKDSSRDIQSHSSGNPPNQNSNGASNNIDMGSTTDNAFTKSAVMSKITVAPPGKCLYQCSAFQPMKNNFMCTSQQVAVHNTEDMTASTMLEPPRGGTHTDSPTQDFHSIYNNNHSCIVNNMQHQVPLDHDDASSKKIAATAPHHGSSNVVEGNVGNYSINRSVSGSNNGSNGQNGSSTAVNAGGINIENNNEIAGNSRGGDASGSGSGSGSGSANRIDQKTSQREAALTKFRQKRKERCFRKKVRYQSRKKLAEQRPRFRGQFVRQATSETEEATDN